MFERLLIPLDGSTAAEAVLPHVRRIVGRRPCEVLVLQVVSPIPAPFSVDEDGEAQRYVRRISFQFTHQGLESRGLVRAGLPASTILETAAEERVSMICMSTHGRSGPARWVLGSVAEKVLRNSLVPVLVARSIPPPLEGGLSRGKLEASPFGTILVPVDGTPPSLGILPAVREFASMAGARVVLLNVIEDAPHGAAWLEPLRPLQAAREALEGAGFAVETDYRRGDPAAQILAAAADHGADLIAISTRGRAGPARWVLGSVTERALRASSLPLLVVRRAPAEVAAAPERSRAARP